ncbi:MAG: hypothetical protein AAGA91_14045 [Pseudomonadota bacterium]
MYINRALLILVCLSLVFMPGLIDWLAESRTTWYRAYLLWLVIVVAAYWNQRSRYLDEL